jgi:hypothetical protein
MKESGRAGRIALVVASVLASLVVLEVACRLARGGPAALLDWRNMARGQMIETGDGTGCSYADDARLGWALPRWCRSPRYNVTDGIRATPSSAASPSATVAAGSPVLDHRFVLRHGRRGNGRRDLACLPTRPDRLERHQCRCERLCA